MTSDNDATGWLAPTEAAKTLEKGDSVEASYLEDDGDPETEPGDQVKITGTVKKAIDGAGGGVFVTVEGGVMTGSGRVFKFHQVPGGTVTGTPPYSSRTKRVGVEGKLRRRT